MASKNQVRMDQWAFIALIAIFVGAVLFWPKGGVAPQAVAPPGGEGTPTTPTGAAVQVPLIEKTKIYLSTYDEADMADDGQKNLVAGTTQLIKSGNLLETVNTNANTGSPSTAEFNGGDKLDVLADAAGYYSNAVEGIVIDETLKPVDVAIKAAAAPTVEVQDKFGNAVASIALGVNDLSEVYKLIVKRPGDDSWFQMCGVAIDYDDEQVEFQVKDLSGSFNKGELDLTDVVDRLDVAGYEAFWEYDKPVKYYDEEEIEFFVKAKKDVDPGAGGAFNTTLTVVDCETNLQNGKLVYSAETSADADVGLADIDAVVEIQ